MQTLDPYKPPTSDFKDAPAGAAGEVRYSGFWQRVGAYFIDFLIVAPLAALDYFYGGEIRLLQLYVLIPSQIISLFMFVFMVYKYGATPGKMALGLRIVMLDGSPVTLKATLLRYAPIWSMSMLMAVGMIMTILSMPDTSYLSLGYMARSEALGTNMPAWVTGLNVVLQIFVFASVVTMLANPKRRTIHDFIAGTAVIRK